MTLGTLVVPHLQAYGRLVFLTWYTGTHRQNHVYKFVNNNKHKTLYLVVLAFLTMRLGTQYHPNVKTRLQVSKQLQLGVPDFETWYNTTLTSDIYKFVTTTQ